MAATMEPSSPISGGFTVVQEVAHHWFYRVELAGGKEQWKPFTMIDSVAIEDVFLMDPHGKMTH